MSRIGTPSFVEHAIKEHKFNTKKWYGQNFLTDANILNSIVDAAEVTKEDAVIEIGPGLGALTEVLCERAGFVMAYEIDSEIIPILKKNLIGFLNYHIIEQDILKANILEDMERHLKEYKNIYIVANLPYYITTPILLGLLSKKLPIQRYVMMMQLEVANRICGKPATKEYNALSIWVEYKAIAKKVLNVPRTVFVPAPNVDSAVVRLDLYDTPPIMVEDEVLFNEVLRLCFTQRRKTLYNNLCIKYDKNFVLKMLECLSISPSIRAEVLGVKDFVQMSDYITHNSQK